MVIWTSLYEESATNAEIAATASATYFSTDAAKQQISKNQQCFNSLELNNDSNNVVIDVDLDGLSTRRRRIFAKSSWTIEPEDGIFFNTIKITNTDAANALAANAVKLNARIVKAQRG